MPNENVDITPHLEYINLSSIKASFPVTSATHKGCAYAINWLLGRGHALVVGGPSSLLFPVATNVANGTNATYTFRYWIQPDDLHTTRILLMTVNAAGFGDEMASFSGRIQAPITTGVVSPFSCGPSPVQLMIAVEGTSSNTAQEFSFSITSDTYAPASGCYLHVHGVHVFESPQNMIDGSGVGPFTCDPRQPIYAGAAEDSSIGALAEKAAIVKASYFRRGSIFSWCAPQVFSAGSTSGGGGGKFAHPFFEGAHTGPPPAEGGPAHWQAYANWLNNQSLWAVAFMAHGTWNDIENPSFILNSWNGTWANGVAQRSTLVLAVPMLPDTLTTANYVDGALGAYNSHYITLMQNINASGLTHVCCRVGWEFNLDSGFDYNAFVLYWRAIVSTMKANSTVFDLTFCWNPNFGQGVDLVACYPGDTFVDYIGVDIYDQYGNSYVVNTQPNASQWATAWLGYLNGNGSLYGLNWFVDFARTHGKQLTVPEWGVWGLGVDRPAGGDNPTFIQNMYDWMVANNIAWECYFDLTDNAYGARHRLWPGIDGTYVSAYPNAKAKYLELFGGGALPGGTTSPTVLTDGYFTNSSSYVPIFAVNPALQARLMDAGQTTGLVSGNVWGKVSGGTGNVQVRMTTGAIITWNITSPTGAWSGVQTWLIECDDPVNWPTGGIRGGTRDDAQWFFKAAAGQSLWIHSIDVNDFPG